ncbi:MAG: glycoside hydrolase family 66 protein [Bacteroidales bacterium]|nr:glycoside hydrolase family 66 protein [Bacteroidales bacterium]
MKRSAFIYLLIIFSVLSSSCSKGNNNPPSPLPPPVTSVKISTDKASYLPGGIVTFNIDHTLPATAKVQYRHFSDILAENTLTGTSWQWQVPDNDYTGYMVDIYDLVNGQKVIYASIGVDVSSDWSRFPRYGFLSSYPKMTTDAINFVIDGLNRYHINGIQFYDWEYEHHHPLAGTPDNPDSVWQEIARRDVYLSTVQGYIKAAHACNMKAMSYNLAYGALSDAEAEGVSDTWYLYTDQNHVNKKVFKLDPSMFKSYIWLLDPSNPAWQQYIADRTNDMYKVFDFDGYHIDQLGDQGTVYNYSGQQVNLPSGFESFIKAMKTYSPDKSLVMNAVNQFGQQNIAVSPVDFLYTEVWAPNEGYQDLATIIENNNTYSNNTKKTVLTAYMDYNLANNPGYFNTPGVIMTDAVIFAFGGDHLEMGEHMLGKEYFPNNNLQMKGDLRDAMVHYYDFMVAYENLLRDGGTINNPVVACTDGKISVNQWPPRLGSVAVTGRDLGNRQVIHLLNYAGANSLEWRDTNGTQTTPQAFADVKLSFQTSKTVKKVWIASPDYQDGVPQILDFTQTPGGISFTLPGLQYWDMVVVEY